MYRTSHQAHHLKTFDLGLLSRNICLSFSNLQNINSFLCSLNPAQSIWCNNKIKYFRVFSSGLVSSSHHVEPITSSLCIRKTSFTGKTYYGKEVIVSRNWKGPCEMNILSLFLTFIIAVGVISNEKNCYNFTDVSIRLNQFDTIVSFSSSYPHLKSRVS